eukprot:3475970-Rhodomonas_salina.1
MHHARIGRGVAPRREARSAPLRIPADPAKSNMRKHNRSTVCTRNAFSCTCFPGVPACVCMSAVCLRGHCRCPLSAYAVTLLSSLRAHSAPPLLVVAFAHALRVDASCTERAGVPRTVLSRCWVWMRVVECGCALLSVDARC